METELLLANATCFSPFLWLANLRKSALFFVLDVGDVRRRVVTRTVICHFLSNHVITVHQLSILQDFLFFYRKDLTLLLLLKECDSLSFNKHVVYTVGQEDRRFSSTHLGL